MFIIIIIIIIIIIPFQIETGPVEAFALREREREGEFGYREKLKCNVAEMNESHTHTLRRVPYLELKVAVEEYLHNCLPSCSQTAPKSLCNCSQYWRWDVDGTDRNLLRNCTEIALKLPSVVLFRFISLTLTVFEAVDCFRVGTWHSTLFIQPPR